MKDASPDARVFSQGGSDVHIGRYTYGADEMTVVPFEQGASLFIGDFCSIGKDLTVLLGGEHPLNRMTTYPFGHMHVDRIGGEGIVQTSGTKGDVRIGSDVWIGWGVTILSGVTIGDGAVIAASSHVFRDVAPYEIVGGNPAKHIKFRMSEELRQLMLELRWWEFGDEHIKVISTLLATAEPSVPVLKRLLITLRGYQFEDAG